MEIDQNFEKPIFFVFLKGICTVIGMFLTYCTQCWGSGMFIPDPENLGQVSKNYRTFYPKSCHKALKNMRLGSGILNKPIPDAGVKKAPDP
jgi:hypothetical protein